MRASWGGPSAAPALVTEASVRRRMALCAPGAVCSTQWLSLTPEGELGGPGFWGEGVRAASGSPHPGPRACSSRPAALAALPPIWGCTLG